MKFLHIRPARSNNSDSILFKIDSVSIERNSTTMSVVNAIVINYTNILTCRWYIDDNYLYRHLHLFTLDGRRELERRKEIGDLDIGTTLKSMKIALTSYDIDIIDIDDKELCDDIIDNIISLNLRI